MDGIPPLFLPCIVAAIAIPVGLPVAMFCLLYRDREARPEPSSCPAIQKGARVLISLRDSLNARAGTLVPA